MIAGGVCDGEVDLMGSDIQDVDAGMDGRRDQGIGFLYSFPSSPKAPKRSLMDFCVLLSASFRVKAICLPSGHQESALIFSSSLVSGKASPPDAEIR